MFQTLLIIFCVFCHASVTSENTNEDKNIAVLDKGILPVSKRDMALSFYVDVENQASEELSLSTKMLFCCELITEDDNDCNHMHLVGGQMGSLAPGQSRRITLIYVTLYPYNRKGRCMVAIYYKGAKNKMGLVKTEILFDTLVTTDVVPEALREYYDPATITLCDSPDQDPLHNCKAVNCHWKYGGSRSFYNTAHKRCEKVPLCETNLDAELPDIVYVPNINQCKDLSMPITEEDVKQLTRSASESTRFTAPEIPMITNIDCHHGQLNPITGFCDCEPGWTSAYPAGEDYIPSTVPYHMCTMRVPINETSDTHLPVDFNSPMMANLISTVTCLVTAIMVVLFSIVVHDCWIYQEKLRYAAGKKQPRVQFALSKNSVYQ